jgi:hypothetical protein
MTDQIHFIVAECIYQAENIISKFVQRIFFDPFGFVAQIVATLVRDDDAIASLGQRRDLRPPANPEKVEIRSLSC